MKTKPAPGQPPVSNRELSWLSFNARVLAQGEDKEVPLLERMRFLSIFSRNLDEFFMVRLPAVLRKEQECSVLSELVQTIVQTVHRHFQRLERALKNLETEMTSAGLERLHIDRLTPSQQQAARRYFEEALAPKLIPLRLGPRAPLPEGMGKSLFAGLLVGRDTRCEPVLFPCPAQPGVFVFPGGKEYLPEEELILAFCHTLPALEGLSVEGRGMLSVTRGARVSVEKSATDFAEAVQSMLQERRRAPVTRVEVTHGTPKALTEFICSAARCPQSLVFERSGPLSLGYVRQLTAYLTGTEGACVPRPARSVADWRYPPFSPRQTLSGDIARAVRKRDRLLCYPYQSCEPFLRLIEQAAQDSAVRAICMTIYRAGDHPRIPDALMQAARRGKAVTVLLELQARFDEQNNLCLAERLIEAGCRVLYGLEGVKVHAKLGQIVYDDGQRITLFGTGNINPITARQYTDYWLMTADPTLGSEATEWFRRVALGGPIGHFDHLLASPDGLASALIEHIDEQIERAGRGLRAGIFLKVNSLSDKDLIRRLCDASCAGVPVRLLVRGICCLRPGVKGVSENIEVRSIVGRFLEHSRVYCFGTDKEKKLYLSSADLMPRNLHRRAELAFPVDDFLLRQQLLRQIELYWKDNVKARRLDAEGNYHPLPRGGQSINSQKELLFRWTD